MVAPPFRAMARMRLTALTASVEALPSLMMLISTERLPSCPDDGCCISLTALEWEWRPRLAGLEQLDRRGQRQLHILALEQREGDIEHRLVGR